MNLTKSQTGWALAGSIISLPVWLILVSEKVGCGNWWGVFFGFGVIPAAVMVFFAWKYLDKIKEAKPSGDNSATGFLKSAAIGGGAAYIAFLMWMGC